MNFLIKLKDIKNSLFLRENIFYLLIIGVIFFLDRISKLSVLNNFNENKYFINNFIINFRKIDQFKIVVT